MKKKFIKTNIQLSKKKYFYKKSINYTDLCQEHKNYFKNVKI